MARKTLLSELRDYFQERSSRRAWALAAQDGIIATASILLGFAGAGAGTGPFCWPRVPQRSPECSAPAERHGRRRRRNGKRN
ncbi:hypothetical protein H9L15_05455 [Sphingomonas daechungensis]|uniref:Uncharacterized protein n=1 Tax=Sphingomonas daechungensis TaxID=1176646 RepID=A0ABX6T301_9SPHN|nr:hypothetical protein [Sphingomonas daechungensis]QNP44030.1 hypothetical protein H9L15_05455 [Sphingomonas daechungensis]